MIRPRRSGMGSLMKGMKLLLKEMIRDNKEELTSQQRVILKERYKETFLAVLCKVCAIYKVNVHDYCLMYNHYHLLVETTAENLSLFMRQINSDYAIYFNKKYRRTGHLWQGRYKSWYIIQDAYLYILFRYIEHDPIEAKTPVSIHTIS